MATFNNTGEPQPLTQEQRAKVMVNMIVNGVKTPDDLYAICARFIASRDDEVAMEVQRTKDGIAARIHQVAADKAEKLQQLGYGQPPILFEKEEVIKLVQQ